MWECEGCFARNEKIIRVQYELDLANELVRRARARFEKAEAKLAQRPKSKPEAKRVKSLEEDNLMLEAQLKSLEKRAYAYKREHDDVVEVLEDMAQKYNDALRIIGIQQHEIQKLERRVGE